LKDVIARRFIVYGRVQGVGYRNFVKVAAQKLGLKGFARNLEDGTVEVVAAGTKEKVDDLLAGLQRGPTFAEVRHIEHEPANDPKHASFEIF
jgi:acylphosphatase